MVDILELDCRVDMKKCIAVQPVGDVLNEYFHKRSKVVLGELLRPLVYPEQTVPLAMHPQEGVLAAFPKLVSTYFIFLLCFTYFYQSFYSCCNYSGKRSAGNIKKL